MCSLLDTADDKTIGVFVIENLKADVVSFETRFEPVGIASLWIGLVEIGTVLVEYEAVEINSVELFSIAIQSQFKALWLSKDGNAGNAGSLQKRWRKQLFCHLLLWNLPASLCVDLGSCGFWPHNQFVF